MASPVRTDGWLELVMLVHSYEGLTGSGRRSPGSTSLPLRAVRNSLERPRLRTRPRTGLAQNASESIQSHLRG